MSDTRQIAIPRPTEETRLHLYVAWGCPFCHRVLATLAMTGLTQHLTYTWMRNIKKAQGWEIGTGGDPVFGEQLLKGVYKRLDPRATQRSSVPLLVELSTNSLLSTNSPEMVRYFATGMNNAYEVAHDLCPPGLVAEINALNDWLHPYVNRAVYTVGFATEQADYEAKVAQLFSALDELEGRLNDKTYLLGNTLTESDLYLFATLVRFDAVYHPLFKCSYRRIEDYPALSAYLGRMKEIEGLKGTFSHRCIKEHYFLSIMHVGGEVRDLNPSRIIPIDSFTQGEPKSEMWSVAASSIWPSFS